MHALASYTNNPIPPCKSKILPYNAHIEVLIIVILLIHSVTVCEGNPCRNSAECVNNDDGTFTCKCQTNYEGILCEKKGKVKNDNMSIILEYINPQNAASFPDYAHAGMCFSFHLLSEFVICFLMYCPSVYIPVLSLSTDSILCTRKLGCMHALNCQH
jgi:hypothetical protein